MLHIRLSHGCYAGSPGVFHQWRTALGKLIGVELPQVEALPFPQGLVIHMPPSWVSTPSSDALMILLDHPDDEGEIDPVRGEQLAVRLEQLLPLVPQEWEPLTRQFLAGLRRAVASRESVRFNIPEDDDEASSHETGAPLHENVGVTVDLEKLFRIVFDE